MSAPTVVSLFCGIGGLDLGFEWAGAKVIWATDLSPIVSNSYPLNFSSPMEQADICNLSPSSIPDSDIIIGGPPCQSFSLVGKRSENDERGALVFRFLDIIDEKRPSTFVMENVPGILSTRIDGERLTEHLRDKFIKMGYKVSVMKLNAADYLVPQLRRRVFLVGSLQKEIQAPNPNEFALNCFDIDARHHDNGAGAAILDIGQPVSKGETAQYRTDVSPSPFATIMRQKSKGGVSLHAYPRMSETDKILVSHIPPGGNYRDVPDEFSTARIMKFKKTGGRTTTYGRLHPERPSFTINTYFRRPNVGANFHPTEERLITVREAMRLQSIPDHFQISNGGAQDARNALVGNAVPPLLAYAVATNIVDAALQTANFLPHKRLA